MDHKITGWTLFEDIIAHQHPDYAAVWQDFLTTTRPARIIEIGTANGGFVLSIARMMASIAPACAIRSYDISPRDEHTRVREAGVDVRIQNLFVYGYATLEPEPAGELAAHIGSPGTSIVICDGGSKLDEFRLLAPLLKDGDYILAHDYAESQADFRYRIRGRIWNWCEITEDDIRDIAREQHLVPISTTAFSSIVWVCKQKRLPPSPSRP